MAPGEARYVTVKSVAFVAEPAGVTTLILPVVAPTGTVVVILAADTTVKTAGIPLNVTAVAPVKPPPLMVTSVPTGPLVGVKLLTFGSTVKLAALVAVPPGVVTEMGPLSASFGTFAVIDESFTTVKVAVAPPPNVTDVAPVNLLPVIVTMLPTLPCVGVKVHYRAAVEDEVPAAEIRGADHRDATGNRGAGHDGRRAGVRSGRGGGEHRRRTAAASTSAWRVRRRPKVIDPIPSGVDDGTDRS